MAKDGWGLWLNHALLSAEEGTLNGELIFGNFYPFISVDGFHLFRALHRQRTGIAIFSLKFALSVLIEVMETGGDKWNEEYSVLEEKGDIGFIDYEDDSSVCSYNLIDEGPIVISAPFAFVNGKPQAVCIGDLATDSITIKNTTSDPVDLWGISIYASNPDNSFTLSLMEPPRSDSDIDAIQDFLESFSLDDRMLIPGEVLTIWLSCKPKDIGLHTTVVHFNFGGEKIERIAFLLVDDKISQSLTAKKPYSRGMKKKHVPVDSFVPGSRPAMNKERKLRNRLPRYDIPKEIRESLENRQIPNDVTEGLTRETYEKFFKTLLIMEEIQLEDDMRAYNMEGVFMKKRNYFLSLEVPGLAERRPSLVHGDFIFATLSSSAKDQSSPYQGYVHHVEADEVHLKFDPDFHRDHRDNNFYNVHFTYNRINMRRLYQAVEAAQSLAPEFLFPSSERRQIKKTRFQPISCNLNEEQLSSIEMILGCKGAPPYLIHGPPGTGKTLTLVEAILQLYTTRQNARVLICAPSNSAADHILEILLNEKTIELRDSDIFRLNATTRPYEDVNPDHLRFCFLNESIFTSPPLRALLRYRIVISTYMSASLLYAEGMKRGHFSHLFLDESGQASEAETMIPIANLCQRTTVVVLAGDPKQLGPVIYSKEATAYGLGKSYLERLFACEFYEYGDENYLTKLIRNYRCHPAILHLPSNLFYGGELLACKDAANSLSTEVDIVKLLPNKEFPVLFLGIQGCDEREGNNPSWFNRIEASRVVEIVKKLTATGNLGEDSIGVITPYRQQVLKLKKTFENLDMLDIKIGSVEQFQGQEKQVIIVSTVRSTVKHNEFDRTYCLGFLSNPRRFNVAVTRAISLLVIIGNPHIINRDTYWNKLLWYCVDNNSYQGCPLPEREDHLIETTNEKKEERNHDVEGKVQNWNDNGGNWNDNGGDWNDNGGDGGGKLSDNGGDGGGKWSDNGGDLNAKGEENCSGSNAVPEIPNPVTDEAEWSDGWK